MSDHPPAKQLLQNYFDELLAGENPLSRPAPAYAEPDIEKQQKLEKLLQSARQQVIAAPIPELPIAPPKIVPPEIQEWEIETPVALQISQPDATARQEPLTARVRETASSVEVNNYTVEGLEWAENGLPQWAQKNFDVLLFQVSGLTLAVPLIALGQIVPLTEELTPLFGQADWFMGLLPTPVGKIRTVNTAKFVMPERYDENFLKTAKYVISINGVPWGLAVDSVNQPITLSPSDVKWRGERTKRPWLAGTVKAHMCALLDIPMIGQLLVDADRNSPHSRIYSH